MQELSWENCTQLGPRLSARSRAARSRGRNDHEVQATAVSAHEPAYSERRRVALLPGGPRTLTASLVERRATLVKLDIIY